MRAGQIQSLEAVIAALLFLFVVGVVLPQPAPPEPRAAADERVRQTLAALDLNGSLRAPAVAHDRDTITDRVTDQLTGFQADTALLSLNTTTDRQTFTGSHQVDVPVNSSLLEAAYLHVWFRNTTSPTVSVNGNTVFDTGRDLQDTYRRFDIADDLQDGSNTVTFDVGDRSTIGYSVDQYTRRNASAAPTGQDVVRTPYLVAGTNDTFLPTEVTIATWQ